MSSKVDKERGKRKSFSVFWSKFIKVYTTYKEFPICIVEGEDIKYYGDRIEYITKDGIVNFVEAGGKQGVLRFMEKICLSDDFSEVISLYFVDRDFDLFIEDYNLYQTPCYSIENLYTSAEVFQKILRSEFGVSRVDSEYKKCLDLFISRQTEFHEAMLLFNAWIACQRDLERLPLQDGDKPSILNLGNIKLMDFVDISLNSVRSKYDVKKLEELFVGARKVPDDLLTQKISAFSLSSYQKIFRGKFEIEFLRLFLEQLSNAARNGGNEYFSQAKTIKLNITKTNILSDLSRFADTPSCLKEYIEKRIGLVSI